MEGFIAHHALRRMQLQVHSHQPQAPLPRMRPHFLREVLVFQGGGGRLHEEGESILIIVKLFNNKYCRHVSNATPRRWALAKAQVHCNRHQCVSSFPCRARGPLTVPRSLLGDPAGPAAPHPIRRDQPAGRGHLGTARGPTAALDRGHRLPPHAVFERQRDFVDAHLLPR